jgi:hypothetical protein
VKAAFLAVAALLIVSCVSSLKPHAQAASVSASVIDSAGEAIERAAASDFDKVKASKLAPDAYADAIVGLEAKYGPVEAAYEALRVTHKAYVDAILRAAADGKKNLEGERAALVVGAWNNLIAVTRAIGLPIPGVPKVVLDMIGVSR